MASERLSRLQKFILIRSIEDEKKESFTYGWLGSQRAIARDFWGIEKIYVRYCEIYGFHGQWTDCYKYNYIKNKYLVSVSRSIKNLVKKGLVQKHCKYETNKVLTEQGLALALKVGLRHINDKKIPCPKKCGE